MVLMAISSTLEFQFTINPESSNFDYSASIYQRYTLTNIAMSELNVSQSDIKLAYSDTSDEQ